MRNSKKHNTYKSNQNYKNLTTPPNIDKTLNIYKQKYSQIKKSQIFVQIHKTTNI